MALTTPQKMALFQVLDVPIFTAYNTLSGVGTLSTESDMSAAGASAAKTAIETHLAALALDSALEDELQSLLDSWISSGLKTTEISGGSVGDIAGVSFSEERKRELIRERVKLLVPFFRAHEIYAKNIGANSANNIFLGVIR